jgi:iron complex transport system substrate-binding protein
VVHDEATLVTSRVRVHAARIVGGVIVALASTGCGSQATDGDGGARIVTMTAGLTETVFALGLGDRVVGKDLSSTLEAAADLPVVTSGHDVSAESVLALRPTLVLVDEDTGPTEALEQIAAAGVTVTTIEKAVTVEEIVPRLLAVADVLGVAERGRAVAERIETDLTLIEWPTADRPVVSFLYLRGTASVYLLGGPGAGPDSLIGAAGATDGGIAAGLDQPFTPLTPEALVAAAPDILLVTTTGLESVGGLEGMLTLAGVAQTPAGQARRVIAIEDGLLFSFGPRTPGLIASLHDEMLRLMGAAA